MLETVRAAFFAAAALLSAGGFASAQDDCIKCKVFRQYICSQDRNECIANCRRFAIGDKEGCRQRCDARGLDCNQTTVQRCGTCEPKNYAAPPYLRIQ